MTPKDIEQAIAETHNFLHKLNTYLVSEEYPRMEERLLGNAFAGLLSEVIVKNLSDATANLSRNVKVGGYPDLIPKDIYEDDSVQRGEGIEVKSSKQKGGWQGHNPEKGNIIIFRYGIDKDTEVEEDREPTHVSHVYVAYLEEEDWNFSGRQGNSRRTITASINRKGMKKLRDNWVYDNDVRQLEGFNKSE